MKMLHSYDMTGKNREQTAKELTSYLMHKHYQENDIDAITDTFGENFLWLGAGEEEYAAGTRKVKEIFRQFRGKVVKCSISDEEYETAMITPEVCLCMGRMWVATDPETQVFLRVHQRISTLFKWVEGKPYCCHIHLSNPYVEMVEGDVGFPTKMARQSYDYMQSFIEEQKRRIDEQTAELASIYNTVPCSIIRLLRTEQGCRLLTFNRALAGMIGVQEKEIPKLDWSRGFSRIVDKNSRQALEEALLRLQRPGDSNTVEYPLVKDDGEVIYISSTNTFIRTTKEGQVLQRLAFDITERVHLEQQLRRLGFEDTLTGLYNRNRFNYDMAVLGAKPPRQLGIASFDINGMKQVNDQYGHKAGDELLARTAAHIRKGFPGRGYRVGGDEFVVIDPEAEELRFHQTIKEICAAMEGSGIFIAAGSSWRQGNCSVKEQLVEADKRMYAHKAEFYKMAANDRRKR